MVGNQVIAKLANKVKLKVEKCKQWPKSDSKTMSSPYDLQPTHSQTLSKNDMNKLIEDIKNNGISETIKYVEYNGQKYVVDGHHRLIAAKKLGLE